jgi:hypothetical protein
MDFTIFYKETLKKEEIVKLPKYDIFYSAFDNCYRTKELFEIVNANDKLWFIFPQYRKISKNELPKNEIYKSAELSEVEYFSDFVESFDCVEKSRSICIDITGFIRPHLIYLLRFLSICKFEKVDLLYTEPILYKDADETKFAGFIDEIRPIEGCSAFINNPNTENDLLIICAGYDDNLIAKITKHKGHCSNKYYILGFPSLQPDMYQECVLKMDNAKESIGESKQIRFAPASDPFVTAQIIHDIIEKHPDATNIYLSPLSTKPQTVGIALYYIMNYQVKPISIIYPFSNTNNSEHANGINRIWKYTIEF